MKEIITELFEKSLTTKDNNNFTSEQKKNKWIGNPPATNEEIKETELRLGIELPKDYKEFLKIANGFPTYNNAVEPSFEKVSQIQFLKNFNSEIIEIWRKAGNVEVSKELFKSIIIGGKNEEQWFLIIPPTKENESWKYWKFASWIPGEEEYQNLTEYFLEVTDEIE
ncbi:SMI1/KNR4 family protein [Polaribacter sargassicola]|uniref:SMI1/KNR4 family protein n=1 Tax=Polaribacter sargassicola TaxID=2836891 RepID=UPI001F27A455|nr:SMI1/KNR4 family protein [Polaribacter sp. DS7-9]